MLRSLSYWLRSMLAVWRREFFLVFHDPGVLLFIFVLPLAYPVVYTLIYNPEIIEEIPVALVDHSRTADSRELARMIDATQSMHVYGYATDMAEARRWMNEHEIYGIVEIPSSYARDIASGVTSRVQFYAEMSLLLRYRSMLASFTKIQLALGNRIQTDLIDQTGMLGSTATGGGGGTPIGTLPVILGDVSQGFASFIMPGILVLILQQAMLLAVTMMAAGVRERRRGSGTGVDPLSVAAPTGASMIGKMLCYLVLYLPLVIYVTHIVPLIFGLPHLGNPLRYIIYLLPMIIATIFMGMTVSVFVTERETSLCVVVFTSVVFLFLSGLTWPRFAMPALWKMIGDLIPATWGVEGFIRINSNGATIALNSHPYLMMWVLCGVYFVTSYALLRYTRPSGLSPRPRADRPAPVAGA